MLIAWAAGMALLAAAPETRPAEDPLNVRVMTFNIRYGTADDGKDRWPNRREQLFALVREEAPDVLGLQEALHFQLEELRAAVPGYALIGVGRGDGKQKDEYSAIFYRIERLKPLDSGTFWFSDTPDVPGSKHWGNNITRICTWAHFEDLKGGKRFYHYNLHIDHQSQPSRVKSTQMLSRRIAARPHSDPVVVTGDFNAGESNPAIRWLVGGASSRPAGEGAASGPAAPLRLFDTFRVKHPDEKVVGTFNGFEGTTTGDKIDYIMVTPDVQTLDARIVRSHEDGRYPSDHFPVTATVRFGPK